MSTLDCLIEQALQWLQLGTTLKANYTTSKNSPSPYGKTSELFGNIEIIKHVVEHIGPLLK